MRLGGVEPAGRCNPGLFSGVDPARSGLSVDYVYSPGPVFLVWPLMTPRYLFGFMLKNKKLWRHSPKRRPRPQIALQWCVTDRSSPWPELLRSELSVLAFLPFYYANLTPRADGTMRACPVPDVILHIAIANELTHTIPPQAPHFSGTRSPTTMEWMLRSRCLPMRLA